jgi:hypothetical protein
VRGARGAEIALIGLFLLHLRLNPRIRGHPVPL